MIIQSQFNTVEYAIIKCHFFMIPAKDGWKFDILGKVNLTFWAP